MEIKHGENKFYIGNSPSEAIAEITYVPTGETRLIADHTYVSEELRGQGIAQKLLMELMNYARTENLKIVPVCPYVKLEMERNPDLHDLLDK